MQIKKFLHENVKRNPANEPCQAAQIAFKIWGLPRSVGRYFSRFGVLGMCVLELRPTFGELCGRECVNAVYSLCLPGQRHILDEGFLSEQR